MKKSIKDFTDRNGVFLVDDFRKSVREDISKANRNNLRLFIWTGNKTLVTIGRIRSDDKWVTWDTSRSSTQNVAWEAIEQWWIG